MTDTPQEDLPTTAATIKNAVQLCAAMSNAPRMQILAHLLHEHEAYADQLRMVTGMTQPAISQAMHILCNAGLARRHRRGQRTYYMLADVGMLKQILSMANERTIHDSARQL